MRLRFANSAWVTAPARAVERGARGRVRLRVRYGVLEHPVQGLGLIDTGYGPEVTQAAGRSVAMRVYNGVFGPDLVEAGQPEAVLARLGHRPDDVRFVVLTHFHADHVCGLVHVPQADFHLMGDALAAVRGRGAVANLAHGVFPELLAQGLEGRCVDIGAAARVGGALPGHDIFGDGSVVAVPLPGHAEGHLGLFLPDQSLFYATDAAWTLGGLTAPGFGAGIVAADRAALAESAARVARFRDGGGTVVLCHEPARTPFDLEDG